MKNIIKTFFISVVGFLFYSSFSFAGTGYCTPVNGTESLTYNWGNYTFTDPTKNVPGTTAPPEQLQAAGGSVTMNCSCDGGPYPNAWLWGDTTLTGEVSAGGYNYYDIPGNDYLQVGVEVYTKKDDTWHPVPFGPIANDTHSGYDSYSCNTDFGIATGGTHTGSQLKVSLRIKQSFVGTSTISPVIIASTYWTLGDEGQTSHGPEAATNLYISGSITVPQTCTINAGKIIPVDFGQIMAGEFKEKGALVDSAKKTVIVPIKCSNIDASANLTLRLQALPSQDDSDAIRTSNPDVGIVVEDVLGRTIRPNIGLIPFNLNDSLQAKPILYLTPVSTTGVSPSGGDFHALAYIRVDFQ
ncbi:TPA: fimbrial protein [Enterobacter chengduensis]|nr:fimbrial protein [Enterobacter chengduensis]